MYANSTWLVFFNSLVEVSARVPHITCLAQVTLEWIDHILSAYDGVLLFFRTKLGSKFSAGEHRFNATTDLLV